MILRSIRPSFLLLAVAALLASTHPSPAPVTVLPETPKPAPKAKPGSGFVGTWRGTTSQIVRDGKGAPFASGTQILEITVQPDLTLVCRGLGGKATLDSGKSVPIGATTPVELSKSSKMPGRVSGSTLRSESTSHPAGNPFRTETVVTLTPTAGNGKLLCKREVTLNDPETGAVSLRSTDTGTLDRVK